MGSVEPFGDDDVSFETELKNLPDEELLDVWMDTQQIEAMLDASLPGHDFPAQSFESLIVHELRLRACRNLASHSG